MPRYTKDLDEMQREARQKLEKLVEQRRVQPVTAEILRSMGSVWPENERVDDFLEARERARREAPERRRID